jgi:hypothetical protein
MKPKRASGGRREEPVGPRLDPLTLLYGGCNFSRMIQREFPGMFELAVDALETGARRSNGAFGKEARREKADPCN